jgi:hypothetical protein
MDFLNRYWSDLIGLAIGLACVNGAITGKFYTHSKGHRKRLLAEVGSFRIRLVFLFAGFTIFVWIVRDSIQKLSGAALK